ncbi:hypothetical protein F4679DRAFT_553515 [Xylaria curta]|nr:hypothetical protein F4679DRAFT_553515 [Xylaria curta]
MYHAAGTRTRCYFSGSGGTRRPESVRSPATIHNFQQAGGSRDDLQKKDRGTPALNCRLITTVMTHQFESRLWQVFDVRLGEKTLSDPIIAMEAIYELKNELARRQGPPPLNPIQRVNKRVGLMDEVMLGGYMSRYSSESIQYVEDVPFGSGRASSERLSHPGIEDLNSALRDSHKGEAVARWIIRRNPELIYEMVNGLLQGGLT